MTINTLEIVYERRAQYYYSIAGIAYRIDVYVAVK